MKKKLSLILVFTILLSSLYLGIPAKAQQGAQSLSDMVLLPVGNGFETPTDLVVFGDVNNNGEITAVDALNVLQTVVSKHHLTLQEERIADTNHDGAVNAVDALEILKRVVEKPSALDNPLEIHLQTVYGESYTADTPWATAWKRGLAKTEISYGIKTNIETLDPQTAVDTILRGVMAGKVFTDVAEVSLAMSRTLAQKKALLNLNQIPTIKGDWHENGGTASATINENRFGIALPYQNQVTLGIFYNEQLVKRYAPTVDIQALYTKKEWTFDAFRDLAKQCTVDTNEDGKTDLYGLVAGSQFLGMAGYANAGGNALLKEGKVEVAFCNDDAIDALHWAKDLFKVDRSWKYLADIHTGAEFFGKGQAAMFACYSYVSGEVAKTADFEMGFVPMPIGPAQKEHITPVFDTPVYVVPKTSVRSIVQVGCWLNAIADLSEDLLQVSVERLAENGVTQEGCNNYETMIRTATPDYSTGVFSGNVITVAERLATLTEKEVAAVRAVAQQELDEFYGPIYDPNNWPWD